MNEIAQHLLDINNKKRSNLFKWNGQFSPQFIEAILESYANENDTVLDPFSGSGTVLHEASKLNLHAIGCDINPSAFKISNLYSLCNLEPFERKLVIEKFYVHFLSALEKFDQDLSDYPHSIIKNFSLNCEYVHVLNEGFIILSDKKALNKTKNELISLLNDFVKVIHDLPYSKKKIKCFQADCRKLPISDSCVDLVVTSPPYINVFNYHQQYRKNAEALGFNILNIAKSEIGSNRKFRPNRFMTVFQYIFDISKCLEEISRVSKDNARIVFIVGKVSNILNTKINNGEIVKEIALKMGFSIPFVQERTFKNRFGAIITELVINIQNVKRVKNDMDDLRNIGKKHLLDALVISENEKTKKLIMEAVNKSELIIASPILEA